MFPALLFSLLFLLPAWWLWKTGRRIWAVVPLIICLVLLGFTCAIQLANVNRTQALHDTEILLRELEYGGLFVKTDLSDPDRMLFLASVSSQALYHAVQNGDVDRKRVAKSLVYLAEGITDRKVFSQWNRSRDWDREVFFLAHAGTVLAHYGLATGDTETFEKDLTAIGEHLGKRLRRGRYKHLISRSNEEFYRPADNAAALYCLSLYDQLSGGNYFSQAYKDWTEYLKEELYYAESRLPCAAFNQTDRCQLAPSATATGLYITYRAAAAPDKVDDPIPWKEWLHYFRKRNLSPFTVGIRHNMRPEEPTRFCDQGALPLECLKYERAVGLWAAAEYQGSYTFYRLFSSVVFQRWFGSPDNFKQKNPGQRLGDLTRLAMQTIGEWRID